MDKPRIFLGSSKQQEELVQALTGTPPQKAANSIGCSIKWKK